jgi:hypothetical protein
MIDFPSIVRVQPEESLLSMAGDIKPNYRVVQIESGRIWLSPAGDGSGKTPKYKLVVSTIPFDSSSPLPLGTFDPIPALSSQTIAPASKNARTFEVPIDPSHPVNLSYGFFPGLPASEFLISATLLADGNQFGDTTVARVKVFPARAEAKVRTGQAKDPHGPGYTPIVRTLSGTMGAGQTPTSVSGTVSVAKKLLTTDKMTVSFKLSNGPTIYSGNATYSTTSASLYIYSFKIPVSANRGTYNSSGTVKIVNQAGQTVESTPLPSTVTIN